MPSRIKPVPISAEEFDSKFDSGGDVVAHLDLSKAKVVRATKAMNVKIQYGFEAHSVWRVKNQGGEYSTKREAMTVAKRLAASGAFVEKVTSPKGGVFYSKRPVPAGRFSKAGKPAKVTNKVHARKKK
jgi:hypothetical protein